MNNGLDPLAHAKDTLIDLAVRFGPKVLVALLILMVGLFVAGWVARATDRGLNRLDLEPPVRQLLGRVARLFVIALFAILALQNLGVELLPLIAGLGVAGAGIALATQGVLSNMVAGLTIIFTKPYRVGEYISIAGVEGQVEAITLFNTALTQPWVQVADYGAIAGELNVSLIEELRRRGIGIAVPQREVRLIGGEG